jgi:hypothetical protein
MVGLILLGNSKCIFSVFDTELALAPSNEIEDQRRENLSVPDIAHRARADRTPCVPITHTSRLTSPFIFIATNNFCLAMSHVVDGHLQNMVA